MPNRAADGAPAPVLATPCKNGQRRRQPRTGGAMPFDTPATENAERHTTRLTKRYLAKPFWVLLVPFLFPSALAAEPSLAETIQYIEAKISAVGGYQKYFRLNGGIVTYIHTYDLDGSAKTFTFQLGALSTTVDVKSDAVTVSCTRGVCISSRDVYRDSDGEIENTTTRTIGEIDIPVNHKDIERVQKALTHAIKLSGGKDELF